MVSRLHHVAFFGADLEVKELCLGVALWNSYLSKQRQLCLDLRLTVTLRLSNTILVLWDLSPLKKERRRWTLWETNCPIMNRISHHCLCCLIFSRPGLQHEITINYPQAGPPLFLFCCLHSAAVLFFSHLTFVVPSGH